MFERGSTYTQTPAALNTQHPTHALTHTHTHTRSTTVFSHSQTVVLCGSCSTVLCTPTGGRARLTEGELLLLVLALSLASSHDTAHTHTAWHEGQRAGGRWIKGEREGVGCLCVCVCVQQHTLKLWAADTDA